MPDSPKDPAPAVRSPTRAERRLLDHVAEIRSVAPTQAGSLAFLSRLLVQTSLPYRRVPGGTWTRRNGALTVTLQAPPHVGLPYGRYPRLLVAWIGREAVRTRSSTLHLGSSLSALMRELGLGTSGGAHGPMGRVRDQARRLFATSISSSWSAADGSAHVEEGLRVSSRSFVWWASGDDAVAFERDSYLVLSEELFRELLQHPVPVDMRVLRALTSALAMDIYTWLTYRFFSLRRPLLVPWGELAVQFGSQQQALRNFKIRWARALERVLLLYPAARVEVTPDGVLLRPSPPHVRPYR